MIGSINGPDAPKAVAWLEHRYDEYVAALDAFRRQQTATLRRYNRWARANGRPPSFRPSRARLFTDAERLRAESVRARWVAVSSTSGDDTYRRPMFELLLDYECGCDCPWGDDA